ncbi:MAG: hypothetical protein Greene041662_39 [Candidatus Peregrinibacteria bacterium Greene0416_62]|nr:MAG: hypothetical protein Greene041662_39 [Candidatus Peregrinibacteria bacterium Greene0416_62]TSC99789.1 MAG: hypothetical protein Greene101449_523 [Candidatus Peregrinibacteria bacterium Greene1014_49]
MTPFVKLVTKILGIVLVVVGIAGFFVDGQLLMFEVDTTHNIVHIATGVLGLLASGTYSYSRLFLIIFGLVYAVVTVLGFAMNGDILGFFHVNMEDSYLHAAIAAVSLLVGFGSKKSV